MKSYNKISTRRNGATAVSRFPETVKNVSECTKVINTLKDQESGFHLPPLLRVKNVKSVRIKETFGSPAASDDNSELPESRMLRLAYLPPKRKAKEKFYGPIDENGQLRFPKKKSLKEIEKEKNLQLEKAKSVMTGFVPLIDLLNGEYYRKKAEERDLKAKRIARMKLRKIQLKKIAMENEIKFLASLQAGLPSMPEDQLDILLKQTVSECTVSVSCEDVERIQYYIKTPYTDKFTSPYPPTWLYKAKGKLSAKDSRKSKSPKTSALFDTLASEVMKSYKLAMKESILRYILRDPTERERLNISTYPPAWPTLTVRAPMPWHAPAVIAKQRLFYSYFQGNSILLELRRLWNERYQAMLICDMQRMQDESLFPLYCDTFEERLTKLCEESHSILINEWICDVADTMVKLRDEWGCYAPIGKGDSTFRIEGFFRTVSGLMSRQLRGLVVRSLEHFAQEFSMYQKGNDFGDVYEDFTLNQRPILLLKVIPADTNELLCFSPSLDELGSYIHRWFTKIIEVNNNIPQIESVLFPEFANQGLCLFAVQEEEEYVTHLIDKTLNHFKANRIGPTTYLNLYSQYQFVLDGSARDELMKMYEANPFPLLKEFTRKIHSYEVIRDEIAFLRRHIPLSMIMLDCCIVNDYMWNTVSNIRQHVVDYFTTINRQHNRGICDVYQSMSQRASEMPETTAQLVELLNFICDCRDITMFDLKEKSRTTAENVLFFDGAC